MATEPSNFFDSRIESELSRINTESMANKFDATQRASEEKASMFSRMAAEAKIREEADRLSTVGRWNSLVGLDQDGAVASAIDGTAAIAVGAGRVAGHLASAVPNALAANEQSYLNDADYSAYQKFNAGTATDADMAQLNRMPQTEKLLEKKYLTDYARAAYAAEKTPTALEMIQKTDNLRQLGTDINKAADWSSLMRQDKRESLMESVGRNFETNADQSIKGVKQIKEGNVFEGASNAALGVGKILYQGLAGAGDNKEALAQYALENLPQLALGLFGQAGKASLIASNVGYAADYYSKGIDAYKAANKGAMPPDAELQTMAIKAASLALAEQVGDVASLGFAKVAKDAAGDAIKTGFKASLLNVAKAAGKGFATEAATEAVQTGLEDNLEGKEFSGKSIFQGAVIGGFSGAQLSGGIRAIGEVTKTTPEQIQANNDEVGKQEAFVAAVESGDITRYTNEKEKTYDPESAVNVLRARTVKKDVPPEEQAANLEAASTIVAAAEARLESLVQEKELTSPEALKTKVAELEKSISEVDSTAPSSIQELAALTAELEIYNESLQDAISKPVSKKQAEALDTEIARSTRLAKNARDAVNLFTTQTQAASVNVAEEVAKVTSTVAPEEQATAVEKIITLSMAVKGNLSPDVAIQLANDNSNALTASQRAYLKAFAEARGAEEELTAMGAVTEEVLYGNAKKKSLGITQYRENIGAALANNDMAGAKKALGMFESFATVHGSKSVAAREALKQGVGTVIRRDTKGMWSVAPEDESQPTKEYPYVMPITSGKLVNSMRQEAAALNVTVAEARAAFNLKSQPQVAGTPNVENVQKALSGTTPQAGTQQASASPENTGREPVTESGTVQPAKPITGNTDVSVTPVVAGNTAGSVESVQPSRVVETTREAKAETAPTPIVPEAANSVAQVEEEVPVNSEENSQESPEVTSPAKTGLMSALLRPVTAVGKLGTNFLSMDRAPAFLKQNSKSSDESLNPGKALPLAAVSNLLSNVVAGRVELQDFLPNDEFTNEQLEIQDYAIQRFINQAEAWMPGVKANMQMGKKNVVKAMFQYKDPARDLLNPDGTMDENVLFAIIQGGYSWFTDTAAKPALMKKDQIMEMHGLDPEDHPNYSSQTFKHLVRVTAFQDTTINDMGRRIISSLGIKAKEGAPIDYLPKLAAALGAHALRMLEREGVITMQSENYTTVMKALNAPVDEKSNGKEYFKYVELNRDAELKLTDLNAINYESTVGAQNVLSKVFGSEVETVQATWTPQKFVQKYAKGTKQTLSKVQHKLVAEQQSHAHYAILEMWNVFKQLGDTALLTVAGAVDLESTQTHIDNKKAVEAQNENLKKQLEGMANLVQGAIDRSPLGILQPFYAAMSVWSNFRVGVSTQDMNLQSSKIHRFMFFRPEWKTALRMDDAQQIRTFKLAFAAAIGMKIDNKNGDSLLKDLEAKLADPKDRTVEFAQLLHQAAQTGTTFKLTPGQQQDIAAYAAGAEGMQTLQALVAYGAYDAALTAGKPTVDVLLMIGVDGKTNGPILTNLALGAANSLKEMTSLMAMGGIYTKDAGAKNFNNWFEQPGNHDLYQQFVSSIVEKLKGRYDMVNDPWVAAIGRITKDLIVDGKVESAGRNIVKMPLTAYHFGSAATSAVDSMARGFMDSVYARIEETANGKRGAMSLPQLIETLNILLKGTGTVIPATTRIDQIMRRPLTVKEQKHIMSNFTAMFEDSVVESFNENFGTFTVRRDTMTKTNNAMHAIYESVYQDKKRQLVDALMDSGEVEFYKLKGSEKRYPIHDITKEQEAALRKSLKSLEPTTNTAYTVKDNDLASGLYMDSAGQNIANGMYDVEVQMGTEYTNSEGQQSNRIVSAAENRPSLAPGVKGLSRFIHSLDSFIMHTRAGGTQNLNVHDESGNGVGNLIQNAIGMNKAVWDSMLAFSPSKEAFDSLARLVTNMAQMNNEGLLSKAALADIGNQLKQSIPKEDRADLKTVASVLDYLLTNAKRDQYDADVMRNAFLAEVLYIDQYTWEGGQYDVTPEDRANARQKLADVQKEGADLSPELIAALRSLGHDAPRKMDAPVAPVVTAANVEINTVWGKVGTAKQASHPRIEAFFKKRPVTTAGALTSLLTKMTDEAGNRNQFFSTYLGWMMNRVPKDMVVKYITAATPETEAMSNPGNSIAWVAVNPSTGKMEMYVLGSEFENSGFTVETLMHEMTHSVLFKDVDADIKAREKNPKHKSDITPYVKELEMLYGMAKTRVRNSKTPEEFAPAVENLHEFIAWGTTNAKFQRDILSKIEAKRAKWDTRSNNGLRSFVKAVIGILFKNGTDRRTELMQNGVVVMMANVAAIMQKIETPTANEGRLSTDQDGIISMAQKMANGVDVYTTAEVFEALDNGTNSPTFQEYLSAVLDATVMPLYGPFGAFADQMGVAGSVNPTDAWNRAQAAAAVPFGTSALAAPLPTSNQEAFALEQIEATVRAAMSAPAMSSLAYKKLVELYKQAKAGISVKDFHEGDWAIATPTERDIAQEKHDFIFKIKPSNGTTSDHLSRFAALGLAHEKFNKMLSNLVVKETPLNPGNTFIAKLQNFLAGIVEFLTRKIANTTKGQSGDARLQALVARMVKAEAKRKANIAKPKMQAILAMESAAEWTGEAIKTGATKLLDLGIIKNSSRAVIRAPAKIARIALQGRLDTIVEAWEGFYDYQTTGRLGTAAELLKDMTGQPKDFMSLFRGTKRIEQERKELITSTSKAVLEAFKDDGAGVTRPISDALTTVFLRTGAHVLVNDYTMDEIESMLSDPVKLNAALDAIEATLPPTMLGYFRSQTNALGMFRATGKNHSPMLMMNAFNIAKLFGTSKSRPTNAEAKAIEPALEKMIALYGMKYVPAGAKSLAIETLRSENARTDTNGVEFILRLHNKLDQESRDKLFQDQEVLRMHGFTPEILDSSRDMQVVDESEVGSMKEQGYVNHGVLSKDSADPDTQTKFIMILKDGGRQAYQSGAISTTNKASKGATIHNGVLNPSSRMGMANALTQSNIAHARVGEITDMFNSTLREDLSKREFTFMAPVMNPDGDVVNWRYMMQAKTFELLDRDSRMEKVLGVMAGSILDKVKSPNQNAEIIQFLKDDYTKNMVTSPKAFVAVGPTSSDPVLREMWMMLPRETKDAARTIYGFDGLMIRRNMITPVFGYRKFSLTEMFDKDPDARNSLEDAAVFMTNYVFGGKAKVYVGRTEKGWNEVVKEVKDIIVNKTGVVLGGNIFSNFSLLALEGVSAKDIAKNHWVGIRGLIAHDKDSERLAQIGRLLELGMTQGQEDVLAQEVLFLKDAIARNPVTKLIDAGLKPTIVEDISQDEDEFSYKSLLTKKFNESTGWVNKDVMSAARTLYMAHDTRLYQGLNNITQMSDFVARFVLYEHLTTRDKNPLSSEDAISQAGESFVNYDMPMTKFVQYMDDMGMIYFTKYFLRIQRVLIKLAKDNPVRVMFTALLGNFMDIGPIVLDGSMISHFGNNPMDVGAFKIFGSLDDILPVNGLLHLTGAK